MPIYKGTSEIASGNFYKGSANIENGYKENNSFYVNTLTFALDFLVVGAGGDTVAYGGIYASPKLAVVGEVLELLTDLYQEAALLQNHL